jgi:hypothetical protein
VVKATVRLKQTHFVHTVVTQCGLAVDYQYHSQFSMQDIPSQCWQSPTLGSLLGWNIMFVILCVAYWVCVCVILCFFFVCVLQYHCRRVHTHLQLIIIINTTLHTLQHAGGSSKILLSLNVIFNSAIICQGYIAFVIVEWVQSIGGIILIGKNQSTETKTCPRATLSSTSPKSN